MTANAPERDILEILRRNKWLAQLPADATAELAAGARRRRLADGELIAGRGKQPEGLALVVSGAIRSSNFSAEGREIAFSLVKPGGLWGLVAVLDGAGAVHETRVSGPTELIVFPTRLVRDMLDRDPALYKPVTQMLCYRLRKAYSAVDDLALATLRQRLARQLCTLATELPAEKRHISVTQDELANLVGATRPSVNRELAVLEREGLVERQYGGVTVLDYEHLHELCATQRIFEL
ncbi:Crp/Fnr family transcriptional regulator [Ramlibacter henchirensis]|uniref:Crp/Fnr family transcriptional regulator n=1 Tax=Ramlibacter henchirensis TaxID=204072 RepID=A0A4Z0BU26_9BURK|nr:Crp/Fnr family transcriptional regulator [Ramlibacter henchirensis]TFZ02806.1 Crp/Fnr family transcriptional regulator [Ramlibacter henchirensis]